MWWAITLKHVISFKFGNFPLQAIDSNRPKMLILAVFPFVAVRKQNVIGLLPVCKTLRDIPGCVGVVDKGLVIFWFKVVENLSGSNV